MAVQEPVLSGFRVAVIGAGPAGFYLTEALLKARSDLHVDLLEKLPAPFGLVRYGVAPDHEKIKGVTKVFERILASPRVRLRCAVELGRDVSLDEVRERYHQVALCVGCEESRRLGIPGELAQGVIPASKLVFWYNGHPDERDSRVALPGREVAVVGAGDVSLDVARVLLSPVERMARTDCADHALEVLRQSQVRVVHVLVRRGPAQAAFAQKELTALVHLPNVQIQAEPSQLESALAQFGGSAPPRRRLEWLRTLCSAPSEHSGSRVLRFHFMRSPLRIVECDNWVTGVELGVNQLTPDGSQVQSTSQGPILPVSVVIPAVGYQPPRVPGVPLVRGRIQHREGRVLRGEAAVRGLYSAGWAKRGATGVIGTNKPDAQETARSMLAELEPIDRREDGLDALLMRRGKRWIDGPSWQRIDAEERRLGDAQQRPRIKILSVEQAFGMLDRVGSVQACH